ncbi:MAG: ATP-binding cassette domain-containing protein [Candidatus Nomurabacteria bacterium]|jgi:ABC-2 type transport system ATP-binding protein|nr:ATP-binding cassette domain-containing protein [Candidatus Nomurabacteria bacterium]
MKIEVRGVNKFFGNKQALKDVNLALQKGEIFGFVGANGAGKTTLMRIIMGVLLPDSGEVLIDDRPATQNDRRQIGYMPSERGLYAKMKVFEQLVFFAEIRGLSNPAAKKQASEWIERLNIMEYADKNLETLSTGNQQRVQLAVALIAKPKALILDEPFSGLDPLAVQTMSDVIREQAAAGLPVLFSSHQLDLVDQISNQVAVISHGQIVATGSPEQLRKTAHAPATIKIPTPLSHIFGDLIAKDEAKNDQNQSKDQAKSAENPKNHTKTAGKAQNV